ncbi:LacI family DNA-binding transcriptional regulator [Saxibacter everestensis]|uniref:LacI family DNA-binding transcriptional regulator n=1 Tax=Saxibacter everestensis TaxID=2909229 RepID=A0ABY8QSF8_9MICO|nr:LacI family DNA-binding transcriptional regulator [Brevibacteriaceae bacterium ZFBP1038]
MATMADVARLAEVSGSTVSHVLNGTRKVDPETRQRVLEAIENTGYRHNTLARALATSRTHTIGLSISVLTNPYFAGLVNAIESRASTAGYTLVLGDSHDDPEIEERVVSSLLDRRVDGIIVAPSALAEDHCIPHIVRSGTPLVLIDRHAEVDCDQIAPENSAPVERLTEHLLDLGHTRIAAITGLDGLQSSIEREQGFRSAFASRGISLPSELVASGGSKAGAAHDALLKLFGNDPQPTAVAVLNNSMTIGAMRALRELGLRVPDDVALVCYDDFEWADLFEPRLTAIAQNVEEMGARAVDLLIDRMKGGDGPTQRLRTDPVYQHRSSCGCHAQP